MSADLTLEHDERHLRARFDAVASFTVGAEEEFLLLDPASGLLAPAGELVLELFQGDARVAREFRASQVEVISPVCVCVADVTRELGAMRQSLAASIHPQATAVAIGAHPTAVDPGPISSRPRYAAIAATQPWAARQMLTCGLHVHVAVGGADRALAVYNAMRSYLPEIVALGANAPFYDGADSGLATVRPLLNRSLSRFGVPPAFGSWRQLSEFLHWAERSETVHDVTQLWWDMRLHPSTATIEVRAADVQTRVEDTSAIVAVVQSLAFELAARFDAGERLPVHERERIDEAMHVATRDGLSGMLPDLDDGGVAPAWERVVTLTERLRPAAHELGCSDELDQVNRLVLEGGGAARQREIAADEGIGGLIRRLARETGRPAAGLPEAELVVA
jgi:carboxylate-amine ligase